MEKIARIESKAMFINYKYGVDSFSDEIQVAEVPLGVLNVVLSVHLAS